MSKTWRCAAFAALFLSFGLSGCGFRSLPGNIDRGNGGGSDGDGGSGATALACVQGQLCAGSSKRSIAPSAEQVAGVTEDRLPGTHVIQKFHLGGFGFGPFEVSKFLATYSNGALDERTCVGNTCLSEEPAKRAFHCKGFADCTVDSTLAEHVWTRAFYLSQPDDKGRGTEIVFVTLDAVGAGNIIIGSIKSAISAATGISEDNVVVGMTHSHAAADLQGLWGGVPQDWVANVLVAGAAAAATEAKTNAAAATLSYARGADARSAP